MKRLMRSFWEFSKFKTRSDVVAVLLIAAIVLSLPHEAWWIYFLIGLGPGTLSSTMDGLDPEGFGRPFKGSRPDGVLIARIEPGEVRVWGRRKTIRSQDIIVTRDGQVESWPTVSEQAK